MPSLLYANNSAPFWDFVASLEQQGSQHPFFSPNHHPEEGQEHDQSSDREEHHGPPAFGPWGWGQFFGGSSGMPHRGPPQQRNDEVNDEVNDKDNEKDEHMDNEKSGPHDKCDNGEGPSGHLSSDNEGHGHGRRHGRCHGRRGPGGRGFGGPCGRRDFGPHHGPPHRGGPWGRARWGSWGRGGFGGGFDSAALAAHFWTYFNDNNATNKKDEDQDHTPDADVFDTDTAFVIHVSVPGAKKEDIGVNWDAEKSELSVAGVIYRPGDEEFLKTLAMDERKIGAFERKIRLGTRANPAHIDADGITAKLEDGVLSVQVPKLDAGYVEIRKVDIE